MSEPLPFQPPVDHVVMPPVYESKATPEQRQETLELMANQIRVLHDQEKIGVPLMKAKIRCGCLKLLPWWVMYRCFYCGVWFCKDCAEQHFGAKVPPPQGA
jgi:hypothetical protein